MISQQWRVLACGLLGVIVACSSEGGSKSPAETGDPGTTPDAAAASSDAGAGEGTSGSTECANPPVPSNPVELADVTGRWAQIQVAASLASIPGVGVSEDRTLTLLLSDHVQDGDQVTIANEICDFRIEAQLTLVDTVANQQFIDSLPDITRAATYKKDETGHYRYEAGRHWEARGIKLSDPAADELPTETSDERIWDQDGDGKDGMTIYVSGAINGELHLIQRSWTELAGWPTAADRIEGRHPFHTDQIFINADPQALKALAPKASADPDPCKSSFHMVRIADDADCKWIVEHRKELFPGL